MRDAGEQEGAARPANHHVEIIAAMGTVKKQEFGIEKTEMLKNWNAEMGAARRGRRASAFAKALPPPQGFGVTSRRDKSA